MKSQIHSIVAMLLYGTLSAALCGVGTHRLTAPKKPKIPQTCEAPAQKETFPNIIDAVEALPDAGKFLSAWNEFEQDSPNAEESGLEVLELAVEADIAEAEARLYANQ